MIGYRTSCATAATARHLHHRCTEWGHRRRAMLPVDEIFDVVVDSAFVGTRKPEPRIYGLTLEALGVDAGSALFIDDIEANCTGARELGIHAVWFQSSEQAIADTEAALAEGPSQGGSGSEPARGMWLAGGALGLIW